MLVFGVLGYLFKKLDYPLAPLVLALVLGDKAEDSFRQAMLVSQGDLTIFWSNAAGRHHHDAGAGDAVLAGGQPAVRAGSPAEGRRVNGPAQRARRLP